MLKLAASLGKSLEHGRVKREQTEKFKPIGDGYTYKVKRHQLRMHCMATTAQAIITHCQSGPVAEPGCEWQH